MIVVPESLKIMDIENKLKAVFGQALSELGLNEKFLISTVEMISNRKFEPQTFYRSIELNTFLKICEILHLDLQMFNYGYDRRIHRLKIGKAMANNSFCLPLAGIGQGIDER